MSLTIGEEGIQPYKFSTCSMQQFNQWMGDGHALCLLNKPNQIPDFGSCGNGIVDDVYGAEFSGQNAAGNPMDPNSHGTHCAGTIGAEGNNGKGIVGVAAYTSGKVRLS